MKSKPSETKMAMEWRRSKVLELVSVGNNQTDISKILQLSVATINRDVFYIRRESQQSIKKYLSEKLPEEYTKSLVLLNLILKDSWNLSQQPEADIREKLQALNLLKDVCMAKLDLITGSTAIDETIRFINTHNNKKRNGKEVKVRNRVINNEKQNKGQIQVFEGAGPETTTTVSTAEGQQEQQQDEEESSSSKLLTKEESVNENEEEQEQEQESTITEEDKEENEDEEALF